MKYEDQEDGSALLTFSESEDVEVYDFLVKYAKERNIDLNSPQFDVLFNKLILEALRSYEKRIKNKETEEEA